MLQISVANGNHLELSLTRQTSENHPRSPFQTFLLPKCLKGCDLPPNHPHHQQQQQQQQQHHQPVGYEESCIDEPAKQKVDEAIVICSGNLSWICQVTSINHVMFFLPVNYITST